ncbi:MAG: carbon storage regulator CsrA [Candidatus Marinimicrobia bacterium]|nr:carbon storage regulator CsrA [Candidatus Neomarinimicrobiota bacterium]
MLVLTRKLGEGLVVGKNINLKVLEIHKNQIKIGIDAPPDVRIYRDEVYEEIKKQNLKATQTDISNVKYAAENIVVPKKKFNQKEMDTMR